MLGKVTVPSFFTICFALPLFLLPFYFTITPKYIQCYTYLYADTYDAWYVVFAHPSLKPMKPSPSIYPSKELYYTTIMEVCEEESRMGINKGLNAPEIVIDLVLKRAHKPFNKNDSRMILEFVPKSSSQHLMCYTQPGWVFSLSRITKGVRGSIVHDKRIFATTAQGAQAMKISSGAADYQGYNKRNETSVTLWVHKDALYRDLQYQDDEKYNNEPSEFQIKVSKYTNARERLMKKNSFFFCFILFIQR